MGIPVKGAGVGIRALATIIDGIILGVIGGIIAAVLGTGLSGGHLGGSYYFWLLVAGFCYYTYFESSRGQLPANYCVDLKLSKSTVLTVIFVQPPCGRFAGLLTA